jgi:hypothetical protein
MERQLGSVKKCNNTLLGREVGMTTKNKVNSLKLGHLRKRK